MQKTSLYITFGLLLAIIVSLNSCTKKVNGIDNDQVIETPYGLFFSDTAGSLFSTTDGKTVRTVVKADGTPCRSLCTDGNNILWVKNNLYVSTNNGVNFNHGFDSISTFPFSTCNGLWMDLNQSMMVNIPDWGITFVTNNYPDPAGNYLGVSFSLNLGGILGSWWVDIPDTPTTPGAATNMGLYSPAPWTIRMTSFALLKNGYLCGYDANSNRNFYRSKNSLWNESTGNPDSSVFNGLGSPLNYSGAPLPHHKISGLLTPTYPVVDTEAKYSYGHFNNRLIAIDNINCNGNGAYYSDDLGKNWTRYTGLPSKPLLCISAPFEEICLIGTDSAGLYELNTNTGAWQQQVNNGLGTNIVVRNIAFKENIFKNGTHAKYIYLATNQGIYQSTDGGNKWVKTIPGNYVAVY